MTTINPITRTEVFEIAIDLGLEVTELSAWYKIRVLQKAVYVSKTKRSVTQFHVSGFEVDHVAIRPPAKKNGKVTGHVNMAHPQAREAIIAALERLTDDSVSGNKLLLGADRADMPSTEPATKNSSSTRERQLAVRERELAAELGIAID